jgi:hypothetical protein
MVIELSICTLLSTGFVINLSLILISSSDRFFILIFWMGGGGGGGTLFRCFSIVLDAFQWFVAVDASQLPAAWPQSSLM